MFLSCNIGTFTKTECGSSTHYPNDQSLVCLSQCDRDILGHLSSLKLGSGQNQADVDVPSEGHLIARRAGLFNYNSSLSVCPRHRYNLGIYWRAKKTCQYPSHTGKARPCRSVTSVMSMAIWNKQTCLVPVGSGICKKCVNIFKSDVPDFSVYETSMVQSGNFQQYEVTYTTDIQLSEDEKKTESYNLRERKQSSYKDSFDESALLDQQCSQQSHVESEGDLSSSSQVSSWSQENLDTVVDEFNTAVNTFSHVQISPLKYRVRRNLDDLKPSTLRSIKRKATETVNLFLEAIAPGQSHKLLKMIQDNDAADATENPDSLQKMVVALYVDSSDRSTKKQLLSMISTLHTKSQLQQLIPGLTTYAIDEARKHASTVGAGIPLPSKEVFTRQRIDMKSSQHVKYVTNFYVNRFLALLVLKKYSRISQLILLKSVVLILSENFLKS